MSCIWGEVFRYVDVFFRLFFAFQGVPFFRSYSHLHSRLPEKLVLLDRCVPRCPSALFNRARVVVLQEKATSNSFGNTALNTPVSLLALWNFLLGSRGGGVNY
jgi:hypothetical protein